MTPETSQAELADHAAFVRRLAFHLLRDDDRADDAAQETLARALERPPRPGPRLSSWFAAVLRNVIRRDRRTALRRERREQVAARLEAVEGPERRLAREEMLARIATAVSHLDPIHREVVLLRHFEELPPREIARRLDVTVDAVSARLKRAHARLRNLLDDGRRGNVEGWRTALAAMVGLDVLLRPASVGGASGIGLAAVAVPKVGLALGVVAVVALGAWLVVVAPEEAPPSADESTTAPAESQGEVAGLRGRTARAPAPSAPPTPSETRPGAARESEGVPTGGASPRGAPEVEPRAVMEVTSLLSPPDVVMGRVLGTDGVPGGRVELLPNLPFATAEAKADPRWPAEVLLARDGSFRFDGVPTGAFLVRLHGPGNTVREAGLPVPQTERGNHHQAFPLGTATLHGRLFDRAGAPLVGVGVAVRPEAWTMLGSAHIASSKSGADGEYRIEGLVTGGYHVFAIVGKDASGGDDYRTDRAVLERGETRRLDLGAPSLERTWSGTARFASGTPLRPPSVLVLYREAAGSRTVLHVPVDESGRFSQRVPPGTYDVNAWQKTRVGGTVAWRTSVTIGEADVASDLAIAGVVVSGVVRDARDRRVRRGAVVRLFPADAPPEAIARAPRVHTASDGTFRFEEVAEGRWTALASPAEEVGPLAARVSFAVTSSRDVDSLELDLPAD